MKKIQVLVTLLILLGATDWVRAQKEPLLDSVPTTKEGFVRSEPAVLHTIDWLEQTPFNKHKSQRNQLTSLLSAWMVSSPTVTILTNQNILTFTKTNDKLLIIFLGGWTKYCLENSYSTDTVKCTLAGVESAIHAYKKGNGLKKDPNMDKLVAMQQKNELEDWIKKQLRNY